MAFKGVSLRRPSGKNKFMLDIGLKEFEKELIKGERRQLAKAAKLFKKNIETEIISKGIVDDGDLLQGVSEQRYNHSFLVGMSKPAYHAFIVEFGTKERFTTGKGEWRKKARSTGAMKAKPFFLPAYRKSLPEMQKILTEEWV